MRIVSLISSGTEVLCKLGLEKNLVGISHECDYPSSIRGLPVVSEPNLNPENSSSEIDRTISELVQQGLSIYKIKEDILKSLSPDIIVTQGQCEVCAVSLKDVESAVCRLTLKQTQICSLKPHTLKDIEHDFELIGKFTRKESEAKKLIATFLSGLETIQSQIKTPSRPRVLCIEWLDPLIVAGGWIPELVKIAGGEPLIVGPQEKFKKITWEKAYASDPDLIAIFPCGYPLAKTLDELKTPLRKNFSPFRALVEKKIYVCDGNSYFNRPGPRIVDSAQILASLIHPDIFSDYQHLFQNAIKSFGI